MALLRWLALLVAGGSFAALACTKAPPPLAPSDEAEVIIVHAPGAPPVALLAGQEPLTLTTAERTEDGYRLQGASYGLDWEQARARLKRAAIGSELRVERGGLYFRGRRVELANGDQMRDVREAVRFRGWVVGLGRSARRELDAALTTSELSCELFFFREGAQQAQLSVPLGAFPRGEIGLLLLRRTSTTPQAR